MPYSIYTIIHRASGKTYVGLTAKRPLTRWSEHCSQAKYYAQRQTRRAPLWVALNEYGRNAFDFEVVDTVATAKEASIREQQWMLALQMIGVPTLNNISGGGLGNPQARRIAEAIAKREERYQESLAEMIRQNPHLGKPFNHSMLSTGLTMGKSDWAAA